MLTKIPPSTSTATKRSEGESSCILDLHNAAVIIHTGYNYVYMYVCLNICLVSVTYDLYIACVILQVNDKGYATGILSYAMINNFRGFITDIRKLNSKKLAFM
jgi:hypothetical protein